MSSGRNPQAASDTQYKYNVRDAALLGASLAFSKPPVKPKPLVNTYTGSGNGALVAATKVGTPPPVKRDWTGGSSRSVGGSTRRPEASPLQYNSRSNSSNTLPVPDYSPSRESSPSNIAARLAALRHSPARPILQPGPAPILSERHRDERDVLPLPGSVGNVLARIEPQKPIQPQHKRSYTLESVSSLNAARSQPDHSPTDDTPIPPTTSLVKMFEQNRSTSPLPTPAQRSPPPIRSPKPQRVFSIPQEPEDNVVVRRTKTLSPPPLKPKPVQQIRPTTPHTNDGPKDQIRDISTREPMKSPPIRQKSLQLIRTQTLTPPPKPPPVRGVRSRSILQSNSRPTSAHSRPSLSLESPDSFKSAEEFIQLGKLNSREEHAQTKEKQPPPAPPTRRSQTNRMDNVLPVQSSRPTTAGAQLAAPGPTRARHQSQAREPLRPPERFEPPARPASTSGVPSSAAFHNKYQRQSIQQVTQHLTGETLSSAIMGAALASSSRNASPAPRPKQIEPLLPPPRKQHRHHSPFHRSPSPPKQSPPKHAKLRTTLRKEPSSSEDEDEVDKYKKKGTRIMGIKGRKHPNKHHEGTRRRWRDQITERERKRYEGVWAANKGVFLASSSRSPVRGSPQDDSSLDVLNIMVQEIWSRSRLPTDVLEEVWDLVDNRGVGRLSRYEFVVGLWLIDQRLKGRKLPIRVSDSVWDSARGAGLRVKSIKW